MERMREKEISREGGGGERVLTKGRSKALRYRRTFPCIYFTDIYSISEHGGRQMIIH